MATMVFTKEEWMSALKGVKDAYRIFLPVKHEDYHAFELLSDETSPDFEFQNTRLSPKSLIYPQSERMFEYSLDEKEDEAHILKETPKEFHHELSDEIEFGVAAHFTRHFAQQVLRKGLPTDVDLLKIDIPATATPQTPWRAASISRQRYFQPTSKDSHGLDGPKEIDYHIHVDHDTLEPGSDVHIFAVEKLVSVVPMTIDMTAPIALKNLATFFNGPS